MPLKCNAHHLRGRRFYANTSVSLHYVFRPRRISSDFIVTAIHDEDIHSLAQGCARAGTWHLCMKYWYIELDIGTKISGYDCTYLNAQRRVVVILFLDSSEREIKKFVGHATSFIFEERMTINCQFDWNSFSEMCKRDNIHYRSRK